MQRLLRKNPFFWFVALAGVCQNLSADDFWQIITSAQVSTALVLIAIALIVLALKFWEKPKSKSRK